MSLVSSGIRLLSACVTFAALVFAEGGTCAAASAVTTTPLLHPLFTNNMVLQRDATAPVGGWAPPGPPIPVTVYDQNTAALQTKTATAASDGGWKTMIGPFSLVPGNA